MSTAPSTTNFAKLQGFDLDFAPRVGVTKYRSEKTGLTVVHLDYDSPIVNGYFVVPTEIFNDSGCPHTLEHLVFMGSKKFPYKGIIDHLANRGFSNGTNAWTDTDHTAYTLSTAGDQGFLQLLPIYIDHILNPTLTKAGFITEVHHIDPEGQDSGVVYSEMQGRENTPGDLMALSSQRLLDPPQSAYRSETGGLMEALRVLDIEQIREYHSQYYVPHNLCIIVCGKLKSGTESLLKMLQDRVEPDLIKRGFNAGPHPPNWKRPFLETPSVNRTIPAKTIVDTVEFPEKDQSVGELMITFMGPSPLDFLERKALDILGTYLTSSSAAPLNKEFIEIDSPLCTYIYFGEDTRATMVNLPIYIGSVPTNHLDKFSEKLKASLQRIATDGLDMTRMAMVIARDERQLRSKLESTKGDTFSGTVITDFLYGSEKGNDLKPSMDELNQYHALNEWTNEQWVSLLQRYYLEQPSVIVKGVPSAELVRKLEDTEKQRIQDQIKKLGPEGLEAAARALKEAKAEHDKPIPSDILTAFPVPDVGTISWIPVASCQENGTGSTVNAPKETAQSSSKLVDYIRRDGDPLTFFAEFDHVESDFVTVHAIFSMENVPDDLRPCLTAYLSTFFALPVRTSMDELLDHEELVNRLDNETVSYEAGFGFAGLFPELMRISIKVEKAKYERAVAWIHDLVYGAQFDHERLQITIAKIQQSLPELKRDGNTVLGSVWANLMFNESSSSRAGGIIPQIEAIPQLARDILERPADVVNRFVQIRDYVTRPSGARFSVAGNVLGLENPRSTLGKYFSNPLKSDKPLDPVPLESSTLSTIGKRPAEQAVVMALPTIESSFATHSTSCIQGFNHPDFPAIRVALECLNATESYLWRYIRGSGLAYGAHASIDVEAGLLSFNLYRSSNCIQAFKQAATVLRGLVDNTIALEDTTLDAAKSSIVYSVTKNVSTASRAASVSFSNQALRGVSATHQVDMLQRYQAVGKKDVLEALAKYFFPLFDSKTSIATVVTASGKAAQIGDDLQELGFAVEQQSMHFTPQEEEEMSGDEDGDSSSSGSGA